MTTTINIIKGRDKVFNEFSFCISENIKNIIYKETGSPLCIEDRIDKNFKLGGVHFGLKYINLMMIQQAMTYIFQNLFPKELI